MSGESEAFLLLLKVLKDEWRQYKDLKDGASREFDELKNTLRQLEDILVNTSMMSEKNAFLRENENKVRDLIYEMEDTVEVYLTTVAAAKTHFVGKWKSKLSTTMEQGVKSLNQKSVKAFLDEMHRFLLEEKTKNDGDTTILPEQNIQIKQSSAADESTGQQSSADESNWQQKIDLQEKTDFQEKIVDFQKEATVIGYLMESKKELDVISITGMPGLGKTTFARKIYEHKDIVEKFPSRIWIDVSENFDSKVACRTILKAITRKEPVITSERELVTSVRVCLGEKEFLVVADNVWTEGDWKKIVEILPMTNGKGKVLLTTRNEEVAKLSSILRLPHYLDFLGEAESLKLLKMQVFPKPDLWPDKLEDVGRAIAKKCGGVPLLILVVGGILKGILAHTRGVLLKEKWENVSETLNDQFLKKDNAKMISKLLEISYKRLDYHLRLCLLYTGLFPDNHDIPVSTLTQLWIAEGFVPVKEGQTLEETADNMLGTLININLLMVAKKNADQVKACRVHDMIREFCRMKAIEEKLFQVIKMPNEGAQAFCRRRLCFHSDPSGFSTEDPKISRVRSLSCFYDKPSAQGAPVTLPSVGNFLRVIHCRFTKLQQFPEVKNLILLKHITVFIQDLRVLPEDISHLINLQTLIVDTNLGSIVVKANIWKMIQLRRFKTKAAITLDSKKWKGNAHGNVHTLSRLSPESCNTSLSKRAPKLKKLGVRGKIVNHVQTTMSLGDFHNLEKLKLINDSLNESALPTPMLLTDKARFPHNLKSLTLSKTYLEWDRHIPILAKNESLKVLKLKNDAFVGKTWDTKEVVGFPKLHFLLIEKLELVNWEASDDCFKGGISSLVIKSCDQLVEIPGCLTRHLESLEIDRVSKFVYDSAKKIEAEKEANKTKVSPWEIPFKLTIGPGCDQFLFSGTIKADTDVKSSQKI